MLRAEVLELLRGVCARLRAEVASGAEQDRHVMSQTSGQPRSFPVPIRWLHAGSDPLDPITAINAVSAR
jgi:hypothetical protein